MSEPNGKIYEAKEQLFSLPLDSTDGRIHIAIEVTVNVVPAPPLPEYFKELARQMADAMCAPPDGTIALSGEIGPIEIDEAQRRAIILAAGGDPDATELGE